MRVTATSRSDTRSTVVWCRAGGAPPTLLSLIGLLLAFQFIDHLVRRVETRRPEMAVALDRLLGSDLYLKRDSGDVVRLQPQ